MRSLLVCLALAGCARAGKENIIIGGIIDAGPRRDASEIPPDAMIDAPAVQISPTGTATETIPPGGPSEGAAAGVRAATGND
jgi:hypothetical protein